MSLTESEKKLEKRLIKSFGGLDVIKDFYRYRAGTERLGGSLVTMLQNRIRKRYKTNDNNLRMLQKGEGPHVPVTNYCGPGTNLEAADSVGTVKGKYEPLDKICQTHDHSYALASDDTLTKDEKKDHIMNADKIMIEKIDALDDDLRKDKWTRLSRAGIALKNYTEKTLGRTLYGGKSVNFDIDKYMKGLVKTVVDHDLGVKDLKRLYEVKVKEVDTKYKDTKLKIPKLDSSFVKMESKFLMEKYSERERMKKKDSTMYKFEMYATQVLDSTIKQFKDPNTKKEYRINELGEVGWVKLVSLHYRRTFDDVDIYFPLIPILRNEDDMPGYIFTTYQELTPIYGKPLKEVIKRLSELVENDSSKGLLRVNVKVKTLEDTPIGIMIDHLFLRQLANQNSEFGPLLGQDRLFRKMGYAMVKVEQKKGFRTKNNEKNALIHRIDYLEEDESEEL